MMRSRCFLLSVALLFTLPVGCGGPVDGSPAQSAEQGSVDQALVSGTNLTVEGVSLQSYCDYSGCSVIFNNTVCNRGTVPVYGSSLGGRWDNYGNIISNCSGRWDATNTFGYYSYPTPGNCINMVIYGPGYVGSKVGYGTYLNYTAMIDNYCQLSESSESDNTYSESLRVQ